MTTSSATLHLPSLQLTLTFRQILALRAIVRAFSVLVPEKPLQVDEVAASPAVDSAAGAMRFSGDPSEKYSVEVDCTQLQIHLMNDVRGLTRNFARFRCTDMRVVTTSSGFLTTVFAEMGLSICTFQTSRQSWVPLLHPWKFFVNTQLGRGSQSILLNSEKVFLTKG